MRNSRFIQDILDLASEQKWTCRPSQRGYQLKPPPNVVRPGYELIFVFDPGADSHAQQVIHNRLQRAGLKFHDEPKPTKATPMSASKSETLAVKSFTITASSLMPDPLSLYDQARAKVNAIVSHCGDLEALIGQMEKAGTADSADLARVRELLTLLNRK